MKKNQHGNPWTPERTEKAVAMWKAGHSATEIQLALACEITRSAVLGKVARMGLCRGKGNVRAFVASPDGTLRSSRAPKPRKPRIAPPKPQLPKALSPTVVAAFKPNGKPVSLKQLAPYHLFVHCRWPIEQNGGPMMYCGAEPVPNVAYCAKHCQVAYNKPIRSAYFNGVART
jgi:hypothetical protein